MVKTSVYIRPSPKREKKDERKNVQTTPPAPTASAIDPCPTFIHISRTAVNYLRWHNGNVFAYPFKSRGKRLVKKAYAEIERKCTPRQIAPVAYKKRKLIRGAKSLVALTSPCATSTFQSKEAANRAFYAP